MDTTPSNVNETTKEDMAKLSSVCPKGQHVKALGQNLPCLWNVCTCEGGTPATGVNCPVQGEERCLYCLPNHLHTPDGHCVNLIFPSIKTANAQAHLFKHVPEAFPEGVPMEHLQKPIPRTAQELADAISNIKSANESAAAAEQQMEHAATRASQHTPGSLSGGQSSQPSDADEADHIRSVHTRKSGTHKRDISASLAESEEEVSSQKDANLGSSRHERREKYKKTKLR
jgi:hypothetical protein